MTLTGSQIALVRETFEALREDREIKSLYFYERLFRLDPSLRELFRNDVEDQGMRFMSTLTVIVDNLDNPEKISDRYRDLGQGHRALGVKAAYFTTMEEALVETMRHYLGERFTAEAEAAWREAFRQISKTIIQSGDIPTD